MKGTDPDHECEGSPAECGANNTGCNGSTTAPACNKYPDDAVCVQAGCADAKMTPQRSCHAGSCSPDLSTMCGAYQCLPDGTACGTSCAQDGDCIATYRCDSHAKCVLDQGGARLLWAVTYDASETKVRGAGSLAVDSRDNAIFAVSCTSSVEQPELPCDATVAEGIASVSAAGVKGWKHVLSPRSANASLAITPLGEVLAAYTVQPDQSPSRAALSSYAADGALRWSRDVGPVSVGVSANWVGTDASGSAIVSVRADSAGSYGPIADVGPIALVRYNAANQQLSAVTWHSDQLFRSGPGGALWFVGAGGKAADLRCAVASSSASSLYVAKLDQAGTCLWSRDMGGSISSSSFAIAANGDLLISAIVSGSVNFGADPLAARGTVDLALGRLRPDGSVVWSQRLTGAGFDGGAKIAVSAAGTVYAAGPFVGTLEVGEPLVAATPGGDSYLLKLDAQGVVVKRHQFTASQGFALAAGPDGAALILAGLFQADVSGLVDFGDGEVITKSGQLALGKLSF
jgi:hypothetical protein